MRKRRIADLALFGGRPAFDTALHVGRPNVNDRAAFLARVNTMLEQRWLSNDGPFVRDLERRLAELLEVKNCIAMANATLGLQLLVQAAGLTGEVIVPSFTFVATAHALMWQRLQPVFCDIDPQTHNLDPARVESLITSKTSAIMGVHVWGRPCDVASLQEISARRGLRLFFDAAHALGCTLDSQLIGGFGDGEVFSFHATKFINSFEGGVVTTNDDTLARKLRQMRNFGYDDQDELTELGINAKMSEVAAAMGLTSLENLQNYVTVNQSNYYSYRRHLADVPGISLISYDDRELNNYQYVVLEVDERLTRISRSQLLQILRAERVLARRYFHPPCHLAYPYHSQPGAVREPLANTEFVASRVLQLPTGTAIGEQDIATICDLLRLAISSADEIVSTMASKTAHETTDQ
jgi:dTDP-4-amino-4,6-dideoxygalactose transaminase